MMIAVTAEPFGFGPASKAASIAREIGAERCLFMGSGTTAEFFQANGYRTIKYDRIPAATQLARDVRRWDVEAAIVALDVIWVERFLDVGVAVHYVDSLGFMWSQDHVRSHRSLYEDATYICQDVLSARRYLEARGGEGIRSVGAIVDLEMASPGEAYDYVVNLGGVFTDRNHRAAERYLNWTTSLVNTLAKAHGGHWIVLASTPAAKQIRDGLDHIVSVSMPHPAAVSVMSSAETVFTAPGLTTLLELSALAVPVQPLPPQNYSQCRIIQECVAQEGTASPVWRMLASTFEVEKDLPESEGISQAESIMKDFATRSGLAQMLDTYEVDASLVRLTDDFGGAEQAAKIVAERK